MSKYTEELKLKIVLENQKDKTGYKSLSRKYGIGRTLIRQWCAQYEKNGKFIQPTRHFSGEFKLKVLNYQQEHKLSNLQTALKFGITSIGTISAWRKQYITGGTEALFRTQGRQPKMPKSVIPDKPREEWTKDEEIAALKAENIYLKKLWALIQEEKKQRMPDGKEKSEHSEN